ncbi:GGDEF domain-containing protein [Aurantiacibacter gilvus]|uniref:diguanylate cyclase n=1 Tax=Aurantiacibacter gilvus TaxID=3139141 RepID=A0ABU9IDC8_9SPHN
MNLFAAGCLLASDAPLSLEEARTSNRWDCDAGFREAGTRNAWLRLEGEQLPEFVLALQGMAAPVGALTIATVGKDGTVEAHRYSERDLVDHWMPGNTYALPLDLNGERPAQLYVGLENQQSHLLTTELALISQTDAVNRRVWISVLFAICLGMLFIVAILSAVMAVVLRNRVARWHAFFCVLGGLYILSSSSLIFLIFPEMGLWTRSAINYASLAVGVSMIGPIMLRYFDHRELTRPYRIAIRIAVAVTLVNTFVMPLSAIFDFPARPVFHLLFLPCAVVVLGTMAMLLRKRSPEIRGFMLAWAAPALLGVERVLRGSDLYYLPLFTDYLFFFGLAFQAVAMTIAIGLQSMRAQRDLEAAQQAEARARDEALTDPLTGLANRRDFDRRTWGQSDFIAILDLDEFKGVNDRHGHAVGDRVLAESGSVLRRAVHGGQMMQAWRLGGEEFALAIDAPSIEHAAHALNAVRQNISTGIAAALPAIGRVTASAGLAPMGGDLRQAYRAADSALYKAKAAGRDRLCFESTNGERATIFPGQRAA